MNNQQREELRREQQRRQSAKGCADISLLSGALAGMYVYLLTYDSGSAIRTGTIVTIGVMLLLKFVSRHFALLCLVGVILYFTFH